MAEIKFKYLFEDNYNPVYVNGAIGGVNPRGEIVINFFLERHAIPKAQTHEISAKGGLGEVKKNEPEDLTQSMVRYISSGVVFSLQNAKDFQKWLDVEIKKLEKLNLKR